MIPTTQGGFKLEVENKLGLAREDELVELAWSSVLASLPSATQETLVIKVVGGAELPSQALDLNADKTWDSVIFPVGLAAGASVTLAVSLGSPAKATPRVIGQARKVDPENDFYWENDRIGYRVKAHDAANNVDIFVKNTSKLVVFDWYKSDFHVDRGEGLDCFHIGERPGAGGSGLLIGGKWAHPAAHTGVRTLANGPLRVEFELSYADFSAGAVTVKETKRVRFDAGSWLTRHQSTYTFTGAASVTAVGGISLPETNATVTLQQGTASAWGNADVSTAGSLGFALVEVPGSNATLEKMPSSVVGAPAASGEVFIHADIASGAAFPYYAGVGWSKGGFPTKAAWEVYADQFRQRLASPLVVTIL